jgi:DNA-binding MarR family transcriptional regulator
MVGRASAIQREIKQKRPFASPTQEALIALLRTTDLVRRDLARTVEPHGITLQQYNVLRILRGAGEPLPTLEIAERMIEQTPGITRLLDRLEAKQLVARARCPQDRRQVLCRIAPRGLRLLEALDAPVRRADVAALGMLPAHDLQALVGLLDRVRKGHT